MLSGNIATNIQLLIICNLTIHYYREIDVLKKAEQ